MAAYMITGFVVFSPVAPGAHVDAQMARELPWGTSTDASLCAQPVTIAEKLESIRVALDLSTSALAELVGVSRPTIYQWIRGQAEPQSSNHRARIDRLAECAVNWNKAFPGESMDHWFTDSEPGQVSLMDLLRQATQDSAAIESLLKIRIQQAREANKRIEAARQASGMGNLPKSTDSLPEHLYRFQETRQSMMRASNHRK